MEVYSFPSFLLRNGAPAISIAVSDGGAPAISEKYPVAAKLYEAAGYFYLRSKNEIVR